MNGLLSRLARHAVGARAPTIHAMARLPYSPAPELLTFDEVHTAAARALESPPPLAVRRPSVPPAAHAPATHASDELSEHVAAGAPYDEAPAELAASPANADIVPAPLMPASPGDGRAAAASAQAALALEGDTHAMHDSDPAAAVDHPRSIGASPPQAEPRRGSTDTASPSVPDALLPPLAATVISPPATDLRAGVPATRASAEAASEVHVHIGRIEVTAIQDAATPQPAARSGRQPLSLDAYLARRDVKRS